MPVVCTDLEIFDNEAVLTRARIDVRSAALAEGQQQALLCYGEHYTHASGGCQALLNHAKAVKLQSVSSVSIDCDVAALSDRHSATIGPLLFRHNNIPVCLPVMALETHCLEGTNARALTYFKKSGFGIADAHHVLTRNNKSQPIDRALHTSDGTKRLRTPRSRYHCKRLFTQTHQNVVARLGLVASQSLFREYCNKFIISSCMEDGNTIVTSLFII